MEDGFIYKNTIDEIREQVGGRQSALALRGVDHQYCSTPAARNRQAAHPAVLVDYGLLQEIAGSDEAEGVFWQKAVRSTSTLSANAQERHDSVSKCHRA